MQIFKIAKKIGANLNKNAIKTSKMKEKNTCCWQITCKEGIANQSRIALALRPMILHAAGGPGAANAGTRVATFFRDTSLRQGTFSVVITTSCKKQFE